MGDEKRMYDAKEVTKKFPRIRPRSPRWETTETSARLADKQTKPAFTRELVLRLIDWVKHI